MRCQCGKEASYHHWFAGYGFYIEFCADCCLGTCDGMECSECLEMIEDCELCGGIGYSYDASTGDHHDCPSCSLRRRRVAGEDI